MDIPSTSNPSAAASGGQTASVVATSAQITSDFEVFLQMLTAQMQYQDPLNPIDSTDYATQLATFSGVEQAVQTNDLLRELTSQMGASGLAEMAVLVGKEARAAVPAQFDGQPLTLYPQPSTLGDSVELVVTDADGLEVQRLPLATSEDSIEWAGVADDGSPMPDGLYQFTLVTRSGETVVAEDPVEVYSQVTEVRLEAGQPVLVFAGGATVSSAQITALRDPSLGS